MKKLGVFVFLSLLLVSSFVSAQPVGANIEQFLNQVSEAIFPVAKYLLGSGETNDTADSLAVKVFAFILVMVFVAAALKNLPLFEDKPVSSFIVSGVVAILGVRFITTPELINLIWLPSTVLTVALTAIIPFAVFFFVIEGFRSTVIRKAGWVAYLVIYVYFAWSRWNDPTLLIGSSDNTTGAWIYLIIAGISLVCLIFDREIRLLWRHQAIANISDRHKRIQAVHVQGEIDDLIKELGRAQNPQDRTAIRADITQKQQDLRALMG